MAASNCNCHKMINTQMSYVVEHYKEFEHLSLFPFLNRYQFRLMLKDPRSNDALRSDIDNDGHC